MSNHTVIVTATSSGAQIASRPTDGHPAIPWVTDEYPGAAGIEVLYADLDGHLLTVTVTPEGVFAAAPPQAAPLAVTAVVQHDHFDGFKVEFTTVSVSALPVTATGVAAAHLNADTETGDPL